VLATFQTPITITRTGGGALSQQHCTPFSAATVIFGGQVLAAENKQLFSAAENNAISGGF
jgi:hypothetical protein